MKARGEGGCALDAVVGVDFQTCEHGSHGGGLPSAGASACMLAVVYSPRPDRYLRHELGVKKFRVGARDAVEYPLIP